MIYKQNKNSQRQFVTCYRSVRKYAVAALFMCLSHAVRAEALPALVNEMLTEAAIDPASMSLVVQPVGESRAITDWQGDVLRRPASVTKLITTGVGLLLLGPDYQWATDVYSNGTVENGALLGDLIIRGGGDPHLVEEDIEHIVVALWRKGIREIRGDIVFDDSRYAERSESMGSFDDQPLRPYNALPSAVNVNFGTVRLRFASDKKSVSITMEPQLSQVVIDNSMRVNRIRRCAGRGFAPQLSFDEAAGILSVAGTMSRYCKPQMITRRIGQPADIFFSVFVEKWQEQGGVFDGLWRYGAVNNATRLLSLRSHPLSKQIRWMNKFSNNVMTRQLFLALSAYRSLNPARLETSRSVMMQTLKKIGVISRGSYIDNGAGLSRKTRLSAKQIQRFLQIMRSSDVAQPFMQSLSLAGVDGTLRRRFVDTPLQGNLRGKTGTLKNTKALAGYFTAKSGRLLAFAFLVEGAQAKASQPVMDNILGWFYEYH